MRATPLRRLLTLLLPALGLLVLAAVAALLLLPADPAQAQASQTVPSDWEHIPDGIEPGDSFRLLFVTSTTTTAQSADIADYNKFAQTRAAVDSNLAGFSGQFSALISTAGVNIKDNTGTTGTGVP
ncbi:MAG: hypothetical protein OXE40_07065, partial [Gammaproteobacteria bacterium]|nr:hypothetical protein [Gammaproteobacteria bacterium]